MRPLATLMSFLMVTSSFLVACAGGHGHLSAQLVDASASGDVTEVNRLLDSGAMVDANARDDWTPLTIASREGHLEVVQVLIKRGASVNLTEGGGHTALFWAMKYGHSSIEKVLLAAGAKYK
jgi:ankyrin repeat protein